MTSYADIAFLSEMLSPAHMTFSPSKVDSTTSTPCLPPLTCYEFWLWLTRRRIRFRVQGRSMMPLLHPGEEVLVDWTAYGPSAHDPYLSGPHLGDVVLIDDPRQPGFRLVKRVIKIQRPFPPQGYPNYWVEGDNVLESTDSRMFGYVPHGCILGKVTSRFS